MNVARQIVMYTTMDCQELQLTSAIKVRALSTNITPALSECLPQKIASGSICIALHATVPYRLFDIAALDFGVSVVGIIGKQTENTQYSGRISRQFCSV